MSGTMPHGLFPDGGAAGAYVAVALALLVAFRLRWPWTRAGGVVLAVSLSGGLVFLALGPGGRELGVRWPIPLLVLGTAFLAWDALRHADRDDEGASRPPVVPGGLGTGGFGTGELTVATLAVVAACLPALSSAPGEGLAATTSSPVPKAPWVLLPFQEMGTYLPLWAATILAPGVILVGLAALPYLDPGRNRRGSYRDRKPEIQLFVFLWSLLWMTPLVVGAFVRGPGSWGLGWRSSEMALSTWIWGGAPGAAGPDSPWIRELPGLVLLALWLVVLPVLLPRLPMTRALFGRYRRELGTVRYALLMGLVLLVFVLPLEMLARWLVGIGPLVHLPEAGLVL